MRNVMNHAESLLDKLRIRVTGLDQLLKRRILIFGSLALAVISLIVLMWGFDKGFILYDGGSYLLRYQDIQPSLTNTWLLEHILVKALIPASLRTIVGLRYIALFLNLFSTMFFAFALTKLTRAINGQRLHPGLLIMLGLSGLTLSYTAMPPELSYNNLSQFFLIAASGSVMLSMSDTGVKANIMVVLAGVLSFLLLLSKIPTGAVYAAIALVVFILSERGPKIKALVYFLSLAFALAAASLVLKPDWEWFLRSLKVMAGSPETNQFIARVNNIGLLIWALAKSIVFAFVVGMLWRLSNSTRLNDKIKIISLCAVIFALTLYFTLMIIAQAQGLYLTFSYIALPVVLSIINVFFKNGSQTLNSAKLSNHANAPYQLIKHAPLLAFLFLSPLIGSLGSFVELDRIGAYYLLPVLAIPVLMTALNGNIVHKAVLLTFMLYLTLMSLWQYIQYPFQHNPLYLHTEEYKGVKYEPVTARYLLTLEQVLKQNGFVREQGIIAERTPGLVYLMGTFQPGGVLFDNSYLSEYFEHLKQEELKLRPVVISHSWAHLNPVEICGELSSRSEFEIGLLETTGIDFAAEYDLKACVKGRYCTTYVYFPRSVHPPSGALTMNNK